MAQVSPFFYILHTATKPNLFLTTRTERIHNRVRSFFVETCKKVCKIETFVVDLGITKKQTKTL